MTSNLHCIAMVLLLVLWLLASARCDYQCCIAPLLQFVSEPLVCRQRPGRVRLRARHASAIRARRGQTPGHPAASLCAAGAIYSPQRSRPGTRVLKKGHRQASGSLITLATFLGAPGAMTGPLYKKGKALSTSPASLPAHSNCRWSRACRTWAAAGTWTVSR